MTVAEIFILVIIIIIVTGTATFTTTNSQWNRGVLHNDFVEYGSSITVFTNVHH
jgi:hypothetical protein